MSRWVDHVHDKVRAARREAYREAVLDAARSLFEQKGFDGVTMSAIARSAGVAKGTLYNYFESKEDVVGEIAQRARRLFFEKLDEGEAGLTGSARLEATVRVTLEFLEAHSRGLKMYLEAMDQFPRALVDADCDAHHQAYRARLLTSLQQMADAGELRSELAVEFLADALAGLLDGLKRKWLLGGQPPGLAAQVSGVFDLFFHGARK